MHLRRSDPLGITRVQVNELNHNHIKFRNNRKCYDSGAGKQWFSSYYNNFGSKHFIINNSSHSIKQFNSLEIVRFDLYSIIYYLYSVKNEIWNNLALMFCLRISHTNGINASPVHANVYICAAEKTLPDGLSLIMFPYTIYTKLTFFHAQVWPWIWLRIRVCNSRLGKINNFSKTWPNRPPAWVWCYIAGPVRPTGIKPCGGQATMQLARWTLDRLKLFLKWNKDEYNLNK